MKPIASVSFEDPLGQICNLTIEYDREQYVFRRQVGEDFTSLQTFATKAKVRAFFQSLPDHGVEEEARALLLLYAQFVNAGENPTYDLRDLNREYPFGLILIGSVAAYLQSKNEFRLRYVESTRDIACYVSKEQLGSIRDREIVTPNPPLHRSKFKYESLDIRLFMEDDHRLAISYEDIDRHSSVIEGIRVPAKEHLLVLAINDAINGSDLAAVREAREDVVAIALSLSEPKGELLLTSLDGIRMRFLRTLARDQKTFGEMFSYAAYSSDFRRIFEQRLDEIEDAVRFGAEMVRHKSELARLQHRYPESPYVYSKQRQPLSPNLNLLPVRVAKSSVSHESLTTIHHLCEIAGVPYRYSGDPPPYVATESGSGNLRALDDHGCPVYVVDYDQITARKPEERMLRILEVIAYAFHDSDVRECVKGVFL